MQYEYSIKAHIFPQKERSKQETLSELPVKTIGLQHGIVLHDFKNLLMSIQGGLSLLRLKIDPSIDALEKLERIESQIQYGNTMIRRLLGRARKDHRHHNTIDLNMLISHALHVIRNDNKSIAIHSKTTSDGAYVDADSGQVELVLLNLFNNAVDAMPYGGKLTVATRLVKGESISSQLQYRKDKAYIEMTVSDTGMGMDPKIMARIFEPFYTTKSKSMGSGLGLTSVHDVVADLKGDIDVQSEKGVGTVFKVLFPVAQHIEGEKDREKSVNQASSATEPI